jgi:hypothetical protein
MLLTAVNSETNLSQTASTAEGIKMEVIANNTSLECVELSSL